MKITFAEMKEIAEEAAGGIHYLLQHSQRSRTWLAENGYADALRQNGFNHLV